MARSPNYDRHAALTSAMGLFWAKGYHASSMKQIEAALDMRPGSIYATFGSKDSLYAEALAHYAVAGGRELAEHMARYSNLVNGLQDYLRLVARECAAVDSSPSRTCLIIKTLLEASNTHSELSDQAQAILATIEQSLRQWLDKAQARGELRTGVDCERLARLLQSQIMGLRSIAERNLSPEALSQLGDDMAAILEAYRATG